VIILFTFLFILISNFWLGRYKQQPKRASYQIY